MESSARRRCPPRTDDTESDYSVSTAMRDDSSAHASTPSRRRRSHVVCRSVCLLFVGIAVTIILVAVLYRNYVSQECNKYQTISECVQRHALFQSLGIFKRHLTTTHDKNGDSKETKAGQPQPPDTGTCSATKDHVTDHREESSSSYKLSNSVKWRHADAPKANVPCSGDDEKQPAVAAAADILKKQEKQKLGEVESSETRLVDSTDEESTEDTKTSVENRTSANQSSSPVGSDDVATNAATRVISDGELETSEMTEKLQNGETDVDMKSVGTDSTTSKPDNELVETDLEDDGDSNRVPDIGGSADTVADSNVDDPTRNEHRRQADDDPEVDQTAGPDVVDRGEDVVEHAAETVAADIDDDGRTGEPADEIDNAIDFEYSVVIEQEEVPRRSPDSDLIDIDREPQEEEIIIDDNEDARQYVEEDIDQVPDDAEVEPIAASESEDEPPNDQEAEANEAGNEPEVDGDAESETGKEEPEYRGDDEETDDVIEDGDDHREL